MLSLARTWVQFLVRELRSHKPHGEAKKSLEQVPGVLQSEQDIAHSTPSRPRYGPPLKNSEAGGSRDKKFPLRVQLLLSEATLCCWHLW